MRYALIVALALVVGCGGQVAVAPLPADAPARPGEDYSLDTQARALLGGCSGAISYSVVEAAGCGSVSSSGLWTSPACAAVTYPITCHVQVAGCGKSDQLGIAVDEALKASKIVCAISPPGTACIDPATIPACEPGQTSTLQTYTKITYSCHTAWSPSPIPAGACTASFCQ